MKIGLISLAHPHGLSYLMSLKSLPDAEITGIADDDEARVRHWAEQFGIPYDGELLGVPFVGDYRELLKQDIDAVIVTSENAKHREHVLAAARAGKHVLCEKPLATNAKDAQEMIDVCQENGVLLSTAFPVRFCTSVATAKQVVESGQLGQIYAIKSTNHGTIPGDWFVDRVLAGGGAVTDHTVHLVDVMRWMMGAEVATVYAESNTRFGDDPIDDCGIVTIEFDNGVFATIDCSWSRSSKSYPTWGDVTMEILGSDGILHVDAFNQKVNVYSDTLGTKWENWGDNMDAGLIADFVASVREGRQPLVSGLDGLRATEVVEAAYEAIRLKQTVALR